MKKSYVYQLCIENQPSLLRHPNKPTASLQRSKTPPPHIYTPNKCPGYDTKLHLMVWLQSWSFGKCVVAFYCYYSIGPLCPTVVVPVRVLSMGQTDLCAKQMIYVELLVLDRNTWHHLTVRKQMSFGLFKMLTVNYLFTDHIYLICMNRIWH